MPLFKRKRKTSQVSKKKIGKSSNISELRSPYLKKLGTPPKRKRNRSSKSYQSLIPPARLKTKNTSGKGKFFLALILSLVIITFSIYSIFFSDYFLIDDYQIEEEGTLIDNYEDLNVILKQTLGQNLILLNDNLIISEIKEKHPEFESIKLKKVFPKSIKIEYEKYPTVANIVNIIDGIQKKFLIDSQGLLVEENIEQLDLPHIYLETGEPLIVRNTFLTDPKRSKERLTYILNAIYLYEEKFGMKVLYAEFKPREREIHLHTEKYFYVIIDMGKDLNRQIEKLKKALAKLDIYNEPLVYIDLRISGTDTEKVIYKRK